MDFHNNVNRLYSIGVILYFVCSFAFYKTQFLNGDTYNYPKDL